MPLTQPKSTNKKKKHQNRELILDYPGVAPEGQARENVSKKRIPRTVAAPRCRRSRPRTSSGLQEIRTAPADSQQGIQSHHCKELNFANTPGGAVVQNLPAKEMQETQV